jgi:hypothetical protein
MSLFSNGKVPEMNHITFHIIGYRQISPGLRRPLREANQQHHLLLMLRLSGIKHLLLHVTLMTATITLSVNKLNGGWVACYLRSEADGRTYVSLCN